MAESRRASHPEMATVFSLMDLQRELQLMRTKIFPLVL